jgi:hypothetical protein
LWRRLLSLTREANARSPESLADQLVLLVEGAYVSVHCFAAPGPASRMGEAAEALIAAQRAPAPPLASGERWPR